MSNCHVEYSVTASRILDHNSQPVVTYGIKAVCNSQGTVEIPDVSFSLQEVAQLCALLEKEGCCCLHLKNICEDAAQGAFSKTKGCYL